MACNTTYLLDAWSEARKFDFSLLYDYARKIYEICPLDTRLVPGTQLLTLEAAMEFARETYAWSSWTPYPAGAILTRLLTWKTPLVQLVFSFSRPPLGWHVELFALNHLIGDPIDTLASLLFTLQRCQDRAMRFIRRGLSDNEWKAKTIIDVALAGCGQHSEVEDDVEKASRFITLGHITNWREKAMLLAADRSTKFLPISVALLLFNGAFGLAYGRTVSSSEGPDNWIPIELHSVAFSASFLWLTEAVLLSALIGVSQTKTAVSRILNIHEPVHPASRRAASGALPSWQPGMWCTKQRKHDPNIISQWRVVALSCIAAILVASGTFIAWAISFAVPPERFGCRHAAQGAMLGFWIASYASGICLAKVDLSPTVLFALTYLKDALTSAAIIAIIMVTQWGIFNRSICWVGSGGLQLPQAPSVAAQISSRINVDYPCIIFVGIAFQFLACMLIATYYRFAIRVFLQRDDGTSNSPKSLKARSWKPNGGLDLRTLLSRGVSGHEMHVVRRGRKRRASKSDVPIGTEGSSTEKVETGSITNYLK